jgi:hypothetical protein
MGLPGVQAFFILFDLIGRETGMAWPSATFFLNAQRHASSFMLHYSTFSIQHSAFSIQHFIFTLVVKG